MTARPREPASGLLVQRIALSCVLRLQLVEDPPDPLDMRLLVVPVVDAPRRAHGIAGKIPFVELLASGKARQGGIIGQPEQLNAGPRVRGGGLVITLDVGGDRAVELGKRGHHEQPARPHGLDDLAAPPEHLRIEQPDRVQRDAVRENRAVGTRQGAGLARHQARPDDLGVVDQLRQHPLDVQMNVDPGGPHQGERQGHHEFRLG